MYRKYIPDNAKLVPDSATCVFEGKLYSVWQWEQELFDGTKKTFEMLKRCDSVNVIAIIDDKILIQNEEQPFVGTFTDISGGMHDYSAEDELACAKRELREETGYTFSKWKLVACRQASGKIEQFIYTFIAYGDYKSGNQKLDPGEKITTELVPFAEFKERATTLRSYPDFRDYLEKVDSLDKFLDLPNLYEMVNT